MLWRFRVLILGLIATSLLFGAPPSKPKLVVAIIIDQFRADYLGRFRTDYHGGLDQMMTRGARFTNAFYAQVPTVTAVGHSIFLSGAMPSVSGIVSNSWYDRQENRVVTSVCDWTQQVIGADQPSEGKACTDNDPASPKRLLTSTLGDELHSVNARSKTIGISIKARAAILPSGHSAAGAYWFDDSTGHFVTSTFYTGKLPEWVGSFNDRKLPASYVDKKWEGFASWDFHAAPPRPYASLAAGPWGNELIEGLAEAALAGEELGQRGATDLLTVSFSSNDYVGHRVGPDAPEVRDMAIRTDQLLAKLFAAIDKEVGLENTVVVLSADHGVAATPEANRLNKMPASNYLAVDIEDLVTSALNKKYGVSAWLIPDAGETSLYFDRATLALRKISLQDAERTAEDALWAAPLVHLARVYTRTQLESGISGDFVAQAEMNGFNARRSGDLALVFEPGYIPGASGTTHFSPWNYDRHVPLLFMGPGIKRGNYDDTVIINDVAPTLATMLDVQVPSGSSGRVLTEMLSR
ncbi:MAG TPA: alkaline phosphatase family protein [Bryobacteraceae bacterium]|jgi:predicted AlkP superfamily pyrophosphatase or phosphodiesterase|nr:alkaline phosphatase family protein [Bryobacteraceae bacterium]